MSYSYDRWLGIFYMHYHIDVITYDMAFDEWLLHSLGVSCQREWNRTATNHQSSSRGHSHASIAPPLYGISNKEVRWEFELTWISFCLSSPGMLMALAPRHRAARNTMTIINSLLSIPLRLSYLKSTRNRSSSTTALPRNIHKTLTS